MSRRVEPLDKGLVTIRDPALLKPGELSFIRNAVYLPGSQALQRAKGRAAFGTATASALDVDGLRDVQFDTGDHLIVAHVSTAYVTAAVGDTGAFGILASGVNDGTQLEAVHYRNRWFLFNGTVNSSTATAVTGVGGIIQNSNKVVYQSATAAGTTPTVRQHGMLSVPGMETPTATSQTFSQTVTGYYEYWTTEVAKFTQDSQEVSLESGFSGNPATVFVSTTTSSPVISQPIALSNPGFTTHWRLYRSPKKDKESDKKFPTGFMIGEVAYATSSAMASAITDTLTVSNATSLPASVNVAGQLFADFGNASAGLTGIGGASATATNSASFGGFVKNQGMYTYNFGGFSGNVRGIAVEVVASATVSPIPLSVRIGRNRNAQGGYGPDVSSITNPQSRQLLGELYLKLNTAVKGSMVTATAGNQTITLGSSSDRWMASDVPPFVDSDFGPNFQVVITTTFNGGTRSIAVDYVKLIVYYGATFDSTIQFPTVAYTFGDITAQVMKNGPPPSSSTADFFEDSLVINDISNPGLIRYSYPGDPDAFPPTYFLDFETPHNDRVTNIKVVNSRLIVMLRNSVYRVNYLPSERDASFDRGRAIEPISKDWGCVNEMCACTFTMDGGQERLAFVSDQGVFVTDGYTTTNWANNLDWRGDRDTFGIANTGASYTPIALVNDIENLQLVFVFRNTAPGFGGDYYTLNFQYDTLVGGLPRVSGFVTMLNNSAGNTAAPKSAWAITRSNGTTEMFYGYGASAGGAQSTAAGAGQVWRETGRTIPSTNPSMQYRTRRMYMAGMGMEWRLNEIYGYTGLVTAAAPPEVTYTTNNVKTNGPSTYSGSKVYTYSAAQTEKLHKVQFDQIAEGLMVSAQVSGECTYAQEFLILDGENFGKEDGGL